jgi:hypothetical protein
MIDQLYKANYEFLASAASEIFELFISTLDEFDGSEYQQGKKDGLRIALALLGNPHWGTFNRGKDNAREVIERCIWTYHPECYGHCDYWETGCGNAFQIDSPTAHGMKFCPYCGQRLEVKDE